MTEIITHCPYPPELAPGGSPLFRKGGNPLSRRRAFLHNRSGGDVKQIVTARRQGGDPPKRQPALTAKRIGGDTGKR
jgi:hypothetical protein